MKEQGTQEKYVYEARKLVTATAVPISRTCPTQRYTRRWDTTLIDTLQDALKWASSSNRHIATMLDVAHLRITDIRSFRQWFNTLSGEYSFPDGLIIYHGLSQPLADPEIIMAGIQSGKNYDGSNGNYPQYFRYDRFNIPEQQIRNLRERCISFTELEKNGAPKDKNWGVFLTTKETNISSKHQLNWNEADVDLLKKSPRIISIFGPEDAERYLETSGRIKGPSLGDIRSLMEPLPKNNGCFLKAGKHSFDWLTRGKDNYSFSLYELEFRFLGIEYNKEVFPRYDEAPESITFRQVSLDALIENVSELVAPAVSKEMEKRFRKEFDRVEQDA